MKSGRVRQASFLLILPTNISTISAQNYFNLDSVLSSIPSTRATIDRLPAYISATLQRQSLQPIAIVNLYIDLTPTVDRTHHKVASAHRYSESLQ